MCHVLSALALVVATGCAPRSGWTREDRVCAAADPPRVCFEAAPDAPATLTVGDATLVPEECAMLDEGRGGLLAVTVEDGRTEEPLRARVSVRRGDATTVRLVEDEHFELEVTARGCDG